MCGNDLRTQGTAILVTDRVFRGRAWLEVANSGFIPDDETLVQRLAPDGTMRSVP